MSEILDKFINREDAEKLVERFSAKIAFINKQLDAEEEGNGVATKKHARLSKDLILYDDALTVLKYYLAKLS